MGVVFRALDRLTGNEVALKKVIPTAVQLSGAGVSSTGGPSRDDATTSTFYDARSTTLDAPVAPGSSSASTGIMPGLDSSLPRNTGSVGLPDITDITLASSASPGSTSDSRLALAREFRLLSSLSHPNVIRVLDYGFEDRRLPFYTMERLEDPQTVLDAGIGQPLEVQVGLLIQMLQALAYLHRRGVIHRDIKPSNALVDQHQVKLLDFGISELREQAMDTGGITGTIAYMAPELLQGKKATESSDLFAIGVVAYEILTGKHPFQSKNLTMMMLAITRGEDPPDEAIDPRLRPVIRKLMARKAEERYGKAPDVIRDLTTALGLPMPEETAAIRDSFLQTARLVGRSQEMKTLAEHLRGALGGMGGALLVGGESGVGKSRLLDELRTLALVKGALVIEGQEVRQGNSPYQVWRQPLLSLCLDAELDDDEARALRNLVPNLEELLGRPVPEGEELDPVAAQKKLLDAVEAILHRQAQPLVILLEDLHWSGDESLALFGRLQSIVGSLPVLLVASFRNDERPDLPKTLGDTECLEIQRLSPRAIEKLSHSILGEAGRHRQILDLLQRETEGNVFFVVEVARALAEEAGRLDRIDVERLPQQISTGGIQRILRRRLDRVPEAARALLEAAAVAGRELDLDLVARLAEGHPEISGVETWLDTCAEVAVLEVQGDDWRFAHDKLRENLVDDLGRGKRRRLHQRVAEALVALYGDAAEHLSAQAYHLTEAAEGGDPAVVRRAVERLSLAGKLAVDSCANQAALDYLQTGLRLLQALPVTTDRLRLEMDLRNELGAAYLMSKGHAAPEVRTCFERSETLCEQLGDTPGRLPVLLGLWRHHVVRGELERARDLAERLLASAEQADDAPFIVLAHSALGTNLMYQGETARSWSHFERGIRLYGDLPPEAKRRAAQAFSYGQNPGVMNLLYGGCVLWCLGQPDRALALAEEGLALADELAHPFSQAFASVIAAWVHQFRRDYRAAGERAQRAIEISMAQGFQLFVAVGSVLLGWSLAMQGQTEKGIGMITKTLGLLQASGSELLRPYFLALLAEASGRSGAIDGGLGAIREATEIAERSSQKWWYPEILRLEGELLMMAPEPDLEQVEARFEKALGLAWQRGEKGLALRAALSLAQARQRTHFLDPARPLREVYDQFTEGFGTADLQAAALVLTMGT